jgi:DNA topoisomerase III
MGKRLVITEKPSVARDIVGVLGGFTEQDGYWESDEYLVTFAVGHLLELVEPEDLDPKYKRWTLDTLPIIPEVFPLKPKEGQSDRIRTIKNLLKRADVDRLVNACDAGREGELIFREITEYLESKQPIERLWLQSMTKSAIVEGFRHLKKGEDYEGLSSAAHCRNYADWLIGMNATRALTRRLKSKSENQAWSAGRVQTPTLAMLVDREMEILAHRPVPYWRITGTFGQGAAGDYLGIWFDPSFKSADPEEEEGGEGQTKDDRIFDEAKARAIIDRIRGKSVSASETRKPSKEAAPFLFDLTSLQREANRRFGWSARRTLNAAQRCYEAHKILTYPRTDSRALPNDYLGQVDGVIEMLAGDQRFSAASHRLKAQGLQNAHKIFDDSKISDHFAIIPTGVLPERIEGDDARLFELVVRRFLAAFHPPAIWSRVERTTVVDGEHFRSRAKILQEPGWREVMGESDGTGGVQLAPLVPGQDDVSGVPVDAKAFELQAEETKPPARITEARLLTLMENAGKEVEDEEAALAMSEKGIGTPATRADTIENLLSKGYAVRPGRFLRPTVKGIRLIDILRRMHADRLASPQLTGELEHRLAEVEKGKREERLFMSEIYDYTKEIVDLTKTFEFDALYPNDAQLGPCPLCGRPVYERSWFYRCQEPQHVLDQARRRKKPAGVVEGQQAKNGESEIPASLEEPDCPFRIWKDKAGRYVDRETVRELLRDKKSRMLDGFTTRQGRTYKGQLEIEDGEIALRRAQGADGEDSGFAPPEYEVNDTPLGPCPTCKTGEVVETRSTFICSKGLAVLKAIDRDETTAFVLKKKEVPENMEYCAFLLPRTICKRELTREEAEKYLREGKTDQLTDFISQRGRPFSATLVLKETGRHGFEFPPRAGDRKAAADGADGAAKKERPAKAMTKKAAPKKHPAVRAKSAPAKPAKAAKSRAAKPAKSGGAKPAKSGAAKPAAKRASLRSAPAAKSARAKVPAARSGGKTAAKVRATKDSAKKAAKAAKAAAKKAAKKAADLEDAEQRAEG